MAANWESLFGSTSYCACGHCRSTYGPAAYFVDLLQFLKHSKPNDVIKPDGNNQTPLDVLLARRPDLQYIKLSCENTDTELPYVDLVNEILESYVALNGNLDSTTAKDTGDSTADQLAANPQYLNQAAYDKLNQYDNLGQTVYPPALPFDRSLEVLRVYFEHLGSSRYDVMRAFQNKGNPPDLAIACEYLKISDNEHKILTGTDFSGARLASPATLPQFYGYVASTALTTLAQSLAPVPEFLQRTSVEYADLIELVKTGFLNTNQAITLDVASDQDPCDLTKTTIKNLDEAGFLDKTHRFIRLWKKLGWKIGDVDKAIRALGGTDIDDSLLLKLADVKRLQTDLKLPLDQLLSFWADIDTEGRDSLYIRLFQNKSVLNPLDSDLKLTYVAPLASSPSPALLTDGLAYAAGQLRFAGMMTPDRRAQLLPLSTPPAADFQLAVDNLFDMRQADATSLPAGATISSHIDTILAALRLRAVDLTALVPTEVPDTLTLSSLSKLYRFSLLAKALKVSVVDLVSLKALAGVDPFPSRSPGGTATFIQIVRKVLKSKFSVAQLNYLYRDVYDVNRGVGPVADNVDLLLTTLQTGLKKIASDNAFTSDPTGDVLRQKLAAVLDSSLMDAAFGLIAGTAVYSVPLPALPAGFIFPDSWKSKITWEAKAGKLQFMGPMSDNDMTALLGLSPDPNYKAAISGLWQQPRDFITNNFSSFLTDPFPNDPVSQLINNPPPQDVGKFNYVLKDLLKYLKNTQSRSLVKQSLSDNLKLDSALINLLIDQETNAPAALLHAQSDTTKPAIVDFLRLGDLLPFAPPPLSPDPVTDAAKNSYRLLHKIALLVNGLKMTLQEVDYLSGHAIDFQGVDPADPANASKFAPFDLNALPLDPSKFAPALFNQWGRLYDLFTLRDSLPASSLGLVDVFSAASLSDAEAKLATVTNWDATQVDALSGGFSLTLADFRNEIQLVKLRACWDLIKRLGVNAQQLFTWANSAPDARQAQDVKNTVRAKYDDQTWLTVGKALNDKLRESQKMALVVYIIGNIMTRPELQHWNVTDADGLFEYFLIDVNMSACMKTSRMVQATAAVQLFVRRCLMGLESWLDSSAHEIGVAASSIDASQWKWREFYRVSEAAVKVFTYPENWIQEELRDDKTPFFKDLENELLQNDVNSDTVEQAFQHYLEKLDEVARLEICGMYWEQEGETLPGQHDGTDTMHVFGRTRNIPHVYYYRRFVDKTYWTPWEKVQVDIEGNHLIPVVWNRRVHLFWPVFTERSVPGTDPPHKYWDVNLNWSQYKAGRWTAKSQSQESLSTYHRPPFTGFDAPEKSKHTFKALIETNDNLVIRVYQTYLGNDLLGEFRFTGCKGSIDTVELLGTAQSGLLVTPENSEISFMTFLENPGSGKLILVTGDFGDNLNLQVNTYSTVDVPALDSTPSSYEVLYPHQYPQYVLQAPFFYQDDRRTYFATPETVNLPWIFKNPQSVISVYASDTLVRPPVIGSAPGDPPIFEGATPARVTPILPLARPMAAVENGPGPVGVQGNLLTVAGAIASAPASDTTAEAKAAFWSTEAVELADLTKSYPWILKMPTTTNLRFATFYHPHVCDFIKSLNRSGVPGLLTLDNQSSVEGLFFYTTSVPERDSAISQSQYQDAGIAGYVLSSPAAGTVPLFRLYYTPSGDHLYTTSASEASAAAAAGYKNEGTACYLYPSRVPDTVPLYRLYNQQAGYHFYTASVYEKNAAIVQSGWNDEGVAGFIFASAGGQRTPFYRCIRPDFEPQYLPTDHVEEPYPIADVDFSYGGAYSVYNWELFFHIPLLIATRLSQNQKFEDARRWFHYIFDPTTDSGDPVPGRYWKVLPFNQNTEDGRIEDLFNALDSSDPAQLKVKNGVLQQVAQWEQQPFNPHAIARLRLMAYQKTVVMKYINNLIAWGDYLFTQDTRESDNEALGLYLQAKKIMGQQPQLIPQRGTIQEQTYNDLQGKLDSFSNAVVTLENEFPFASNLAVSSSNGSGQLSSANTGWNFYFCIPPNDQLLGYWDTINNRLFNLRHCMNKEGVVRELPLFQPPIDPALLVQAAAMGVDISSALSDLNAPTPYYRFSYMLQRALELCAEVRSLGSAFLAALEKKDSEALADLRASQETNLLQAVRAVKEKQVEEANYNLAGLNKYQTVVQKRLDYYSTREFMNTAETAQLGLEGTLLAIYGFIMTVKLAEETAALIVNAKIGAPTTAGTTMGGDNLAKAADAAAELLKATIESVQAAAALCGTMGGHQRRWDEWQFQKDLASRELQQVQQQINAAQTRADIAQTELDNHDLQTANAQAVQDFLRDKYTNEDLYDWMISQISGVFFQCYRLAYDLAKRTERAYRFERGITDSNFIRFGYWDSLKKGLLSGERLYLDLKRMEAAYLDQNKRDYEITKHISLVLLNPLAVIALKETGQCIVELPESLFDADYPGHYMRRIKSVTLSIPCVTGPYTGINCTLTLLKSGIRLNSNPAGNEGNYTRDQNADDPRFLDHFSAIESIATSHAQNDSGLFEVNFRDERYLPFEGAGAISQWRLEMPPDNNAFDFETITDVIVNLNYTARDGGESLRQAARASNGLAPQATISPAISGPQPDLLRMFSLKHEFSGDWYRFLHPADAAAPSQKMSLNLTIERFPFQFRGKQIKITAMELFLKWKDISDPVFKSDGTPLGDYKAGSPLTLKITSPSGDSPQPPPLLQSDPAFLNGLPHEYIDFNTQPQDIGSWILEALATDVQKITSSLRSDGTTGPARLKGELIEDVVMLAHYSA